VLFIENVGDVYSEIPFHFKQRNPSFTTWINSEDNMLCKRVTQKDKYYMIVPTNCANNNEDISSLNEEIRSEYHYLALSK
jgi:hypothetical protein